MEKTISFWTQRKFSKKFCNILKPTFLFSLSAGDAFTQGPSLPYPMTFHCQTQLNSTHLFIGGGSTTDNEKVTTAFLWDVMTGDYTELQNIPFETYKLGMKRLQRRLNSSWQASLRNLCEQQRRYEHFGRIPSGFSYPRLGRGPVEPGCALPGQY